MADSAATAYGHANDDEAAVGQVLMRLARAFDDLDAAAVGPLYARDAEWVNAFGTVRCGREKIVSYLDGLFADARFAAGALVGEPEVSIRFVTPDVAVARTYIERAGQQTAEGHTLPVRRNHALKVLVRHDGHWLITADMYMDARDEQTLAT